MCKNQIHPSGQIDTMKIKLNKVSDEEYKWELVNAKETETNEILFIRYNNRTFVYHCVVQLNAINFWHSLEYTARNKIWRELPFVNCLRLRECGDRGSSGYEFHDITTNKLISFPKTNDIESVFRRIHWIFVESVLKRDAERSMSEGIQTIANTCSRFGDIASLLEFASGVVKIAKEQ